MSELSKFQARVQQQIRDRAHVGLSILGTWRAKHALGEMESEIWDVESGMLDNVPEQRRRILAIAAERPPLMAAATFTGLVLTAADAEVAAAETELPGGGHEPHPDSVPSVALFVCDRWGQMLACVAPFERLEQPKPWFASAGFSGHVWTEEAQRLMGGGTPGELRLDAG